VIYSSFGQPKPVEPTPPPATREPAPQPLAPTVVWSRPDDENDHDPDAGAFRDASEQPLLSDAADRAISRSFETLAASLAMPSPERLEELAREQLRPMLKAWMDENLPSLVERLVRAEIQRVARGGR
jgi:cell pole-organizing protein PopZ